MEVERPVGDTATIMPLLLRNRILLFTVYTQNCRIMMIWQLVLKLSSIANHYHENQMLVTNFIEIQILLYNFMNAFVLYVLSLRKEIEDIIIIYS